MIRLNVLLGIPTRELQNDLSGLLATYYVNQFCTPFLKKTPDIPMLKTVVV